MRYIPNVTGEPLSGDTRPPLDLLPKHLVELLSQHDDVTLRLHAAAQRLNELQLPASTTEATRVDRATAATAARAGKPLTQATATGCPAAATTATHSK